MLSIKSSQKMDTVTSIKKNMGMDITDNVFTWHLIVNICIHKIVSLCR